MIIYHYCSLNSFINITKSKMLWMSSLRHMNDPFETKIGLDIISELLYDVFPELRNRIDWDRINNEYFLGCSFSLDGDVLSQWRAYTDNGNGFSLGFNSEKLSTCNKEDDYEGLKIPNRHSLDKIFYYKDDFCSYVNNYLTDYRAEYGIPSEETSYPKKKLSKFLHSLFRLSCFYKDSFYAEEKEIRYIVPSSRKLIINPIMKEDKEFDFRASDIGLTPYSKLKIAKNEIHAIEEIVLGPKNESIIQDIELFMNINGFHNIQIYKSKGNYR